MTTLTSGCKKMNKVAYTALATGLSLTILALGSVCVRMIAGFGQEILGLIATFLG